MSSINKEEVYERNQYYANMLRLFADKIESGHSNYTVGHETGYTPETTQDNMQRIHGLSTPLNHGKLYLDFEGELLIDQEEFEELINNSQKNL